MKNYKPSALEILLCILVVVSLAIFLFLKGLWVKLGIKDITIENIFSEKSIIERLVELAILTVIISIYFYWRSKRKSKKKKSDFNGNNNA